MGRRDTYGYRRDVGEIGCDARGIDDIVERELVDQRAGLQEEGERLRGPLSAKLNLLHDVQWSFLPGQCRRRLP